MAYGKRRVNKKYIIDDDGICWEKTSKFFPLREEVELCKQYLRGSVISKGPSKKVGYSTEVARLIEHDAKHPINNGALLQACVELGIPFVTEGKGSQNAKLLVKGRIASNWDYILYKQDGNHTVFTRYRRHDVKPPKYAWLKENKK